MYYDNNAFRNENNMRYYKHYSIHDQLSSHSGIRSKSSRKVRYKNPIRNID